MILSDPRFRPRYNVLIPTRYGNMIVNRHDWESPSGNPEAAYGVGSDLFQTGSYQPHELSTIASILQVVLPKAPVVLDLGANIGVHTLVFADMVGEDGKVYAFEAQRIVFQMLMGNLALNSIENVYAYHLAVGQHAGELALPLIDYNRSRNFGGVSLLGEGERSQTEKVKMIAIDSLELPRVDFIKMDIEGMEEAALRGAEKTLDRSRPIIMAEWLGQSRDLPAYLLKDLDYQIFRSGLNFFCIPNEKKDQCGFSFTVPPIELTEIDQYFEQKALAKK